MRLREYLRPDLVMTGLRAMDAAEVIAALAEHLGKHDAVPSVEEAREGLLARERAHTTTLGHGLALPHATLPGLSRPVLMIALADAPIQFGPEETDPVETFFVLLSPPGRENEHIKLLARICRLARHPGFVEELERAETAADALAVIQRVDQQHV